MRQIAEYHGLTINYKGFMKCPFHGGGVERTASLRVYEGTKGFHCKACGIGGDNIRFEALYSGLSDYDAMLMLAEVFEVPISINAETPQELLEQANKARQEQERQISQRQEYQEQIRQLGALIQIHEKITRESIPFSDIWCYSQNQLPLLLGEWNYIFESLSKKR